MSVQTDAFNYTADESLIDGRRITIRALHREDKELWQDVFEHMSATSVYFRFFSPKKRMSEAEVAYYTDLDFVKHVALIAIVHDPNQGDMPSAVGRYHIVPNKFETGESSNETAEVALAVEDQFQGLGIGTHLLKHLAIIARCAGIKMFVAYALAENAKMIEVFEHCGLPVTKRLKDYTMWEVELNLD